jgi:tetratricopeptide (TPR) repeat protein
MSVPNSNLLRVNMRTAVLLLILLAVVGLLIIAIYTHSQKNAKREHDKAVYEKGLHPEKSWKDVFCAEAQELYYDSLLKLSSNTPRQMISAEYMKADALLKLGEEKRAIGLLEDVLEKMKRNKGQGPGKDPRKSLALAYLRLGERNNCIAGHGTASCIFPIQGDGVYTDPYASEKAIEIYRTLLKEDPDDLESRWLLNLACMTLGQYPSALSPALLIPGLDKDTGEYKLNAFTDMAGSLGLAETKNTGGGAIIDDFNNDGYLDIITGDWDNDHGMHYFVNDTNGGFTDVSDRSGLSRVKGAFNLLQVDYNNDGLTDIFVLRGGWKGQYGRLPKTLLRNNGDGTFTDVTVESGLISLHPTQTAVWADFNNDGWPDVFIGNETTSAEDYNPCELWINDGKGHFSECARQAGCAVAAYVKGVTSADYNNDNWPDIFLSRRDGGKTLLKNKGLHSKIPQFENVTHEAGLDKDTTFTLPTWFWDYDNDGWPDIFVCGYKFNGSIAKAEAARALHIPMPGLSTMYLYRNNHDGTFTDVSKAVGLDQPVFAMGSNFGDIDNDGWPDMYLGTGNPDFESLTPNRLFKNIGGKKFADVTRSARVGNLQKGHGVAIADVDNDGDQDIFIETGGAYPGDAYYNSFYINPGQNNNNWIGIALEGVISNRSAIGARIAVHFTEEGIRRTVYRDINSGGSFGASPLRQEIGIGRATRIDELVINWPASGIVQSFRNINPRQFIKIREGDTVLRKMDLRRLSFPASGGPMKRIDCGPGIRVIARPPLRKGPG